MEREIVTLILIPLVVGILAWIASIVRRVSRQQTIAFVQRYAPDQLDVLLGNLAGRAYDAVEQLSTAYETMDSPKKQKAAISLLRELAKVVGLVINNGAAKALIESQIARRNE